MASSINSRTYPYKALYNQLIILSLILLPQFVGGLLLVAHKKFGWTLSLISSINYIVVLFIIGQDPYIAVSTLWALNGIGIVLVLLIVSLLSKPFITEYRPSLINWLLIPAISNLTFALLYGWL